MLSKTTVKLTEEKKKRLNAEQNKELKLGTLTEKTILTMVEVKRKK